MYVDLSEAQKPDMWPSDCLQDQWLKKQIVFVKAVLLYQKKKIIVYCDVNPSRVHASADTCVTNSHVMQRETESDGPFSF